MQPAFFVQRTKVATGVYSFTFQPKGSLRYVAGQFVQLQLPHTPTDERGEQRWFSLSSTPSEAHITFTAKVQAAGGSSFKKALMALKPNQAIYISEPMGDFVLPKKVRQPIIFLVAGTGIAPVRSLILDQVSQAQHTEMYLFASEKQQQAIPFLSELKPHCQLTHITQTASGDRLDWSGLCQAVPGNVRDAALFFAAGPEQFCEAWLDILTSNGIRPSRIRADFFHGYDL